jgi:hypothetical protein
VLSIASPRPHGRGGCDITAVTRRFVEGALHGADAIGRYCQGCLQRCGLLPDADTGPGRAGRAIHLLTRDLQGAEGLADSVRFIGWVTPSRRPTGR